MAELLHYGVKGMQWGVVRDRASKKVDGLRNPQPTPVTTIATPGKRVKATGGTLQPASEDAIKARAARQLASKSTIDALSTKELQDVVQRMNLEQQYSRLTAKPDNKAQQFVNKLLGNVAKEKGIEYLDKDPRTKIVAEALRKTAGGGGKKKNKNN